MTERTFGIYLIPLTRRYALRHPPTWSNVAHYDTLNAANVAQRAAVALVGRLGFCVLCAGHDLEKNILL
jgi:hypothetical protein